MLTASFVVHIAFFLAIYFFPTGFHEKRIGGAPVYEVNLVQMPSASRSKASKSKKSVKSTSKPLLKAKRVPSKTVVAPQKKEKPVVIAKRTVEMKKPREADTSTAKKHMDEALAEIEKKVKAEELDEGHLEKAISSLESKAKDTDEAPGGEGPMPGGGGVGPGSPLDLYKLMVRDRIRENWSYPVSHAGLEGKKDIEAMVELDVSADGTVLGHRFKEKSSDALFDQSVLKAIEKTKSVPPIPEWYIRSRGITKDTFIVYFSLRDFLDE